MPSLRIGRAPGNKRDTFYPPAYPAEPGERIVLVKVLLDSSTHHSRGQLRAKVGQDGVWLLERLDATAPTALRDLEAVQVLRAVWDQCYERVDGRTRVREKLVDCTEVIVTPHDPGVRAAEKRGTKWRGDKVHVTETTGARGGLCYNRRGAPVPVIYSRLQVRGVGCAWEVKR